MAFKEIRQTLLVQIDFLANSPNFSHSKLSSFTVYAYHTKIFKDKLAMVYLSIRSTCTDITFMQ